MKAIKLLSFLAFSFLPLVLPSQTTVLHRFIEETNQAHFGNGVVSYGDYLYGTKYDGGEYGKGYIYKLKKDNSEYEVLLNFDGVNTGTHPVGSFVIAGDSLYGTTYMGGENNYSTIYRVNIDGTGYKKILDYNDIYGGISFQSLSLQNDTLYGLSIAGIFKINKNGSGYTNLHTFNGADGNAPSSPLEIDGNALYGVTQIGGSSNLGVIYRVNKDGSGFTVLHEFSSSEGNQPVGAVVIIGHSLYGTTMQGGSYLAGNLYKINTD